MFSGSGSLLLGWSGKLPYASLCDSIWIFTSHDLGLLQLLHLAMMDARKLVEFCAMPPEKRVIQYLSISLKNMEHHFQATSNFVFGIVVSAMVSARKRLTSFTRGRVEEPLREQSHGADQNGQWEELQNRILWAEGHVAKEKHIYPSASCRHG